MKINYHPNGNKGYLVLENSKGLSITLSPYGAAIKDIYLHGKPLTYRPIDDDLFLELNGGYYGKSIAPIAGRIKEGLIKVDGKTSKLPINENGNTLHSSELCAAFTLFKTDVSDINDGVEVTFSTYKPATEVYPVDTSFSIAYHIYDEENKVTLRTAAILSKEAPFNPTNHVYFNLGGEKDILSHRLTVKASKVESYDEQLIPLGLVDVSPALDFRNGKAIGKHIKDRSLYESKNHGYDHFYAFDEIGNEEPNIILENDRFRLEVTSSCPGVVIYTSNYPHPNRQMNNGYLEDYGGGVTLETCEFQHQEEQIVKPNTVYKRRTQFYFIDKGGEDD